MRIHSLQCRPMVPLLVIAFAVTVPELSADETVKPRTGALSPRSSNTTSLSGIVRLVRNLRIEDAIQAIKDNLEFTGAGDADPYRCARLKLRVHEAAMMTPNLFRWETRTLSGSTAESASFHWQRRGHGSYVEAVDRLLDSARDDIAAVENGVTGECLKAQILFRKGNPEAAVRILAAASRTNPDGIQLHVYFMRAFDLMRRRPDARRMAQQLNWDLVSNPDAWAWRSSIHVWNNTENVADRIRDLTRAIEIAPDRVSFYLSRALAWSKIGEREKAEHDFKVAIRLDPDNSEVRHDYSEFLERSGRQEEARRQLTAADRLDPVFREARLIHASSLSLPERLEAINDLSREWPLCLHVFEHGFVAAYKLKDWKAGERMATRCVEIQPRNPVRYDLRSIVYRESGQLEKALADLDVAVELGPDDPSFLTSRGRFHFLQQDYQKALADFSTAIPLAPDDYNVHFLRAKTLIEVDRLKDAQADLQVALRLNPKHALAIATAGQVRMLQGDQQSGKRMLDEALQLGPTNPEVYRLRGETWTKLGQTAEAEREFERASLFERQK